jgi:hypothetical protein
MTVKQTQPTVKQQAAMYTMIGKSLASSYVWWAMLIAFLVGVAAGLIVLGWGLWPVQWYDARPSSLSPSQYQQAYLNGSANSLYAGMSIEDVSTALGEGWTLDYVNNMLGQMIAQNYAGNSTNLTTLKAQLNNLGRVGPANAPTNQAGISSTLSSILTVIVLILLIIGAYLIFRRLRSEKPSKEAAAPAPTQAVPGQVEVEGGETVMPAVSRAAAGARAVEKTAWPNETRTPLNQFVTTYAQGDDRYDMSKSIEAPNGDFLGECGVGISEPIGSDTPLKVTALEVWLFDKNDVRTETKVLMSEYAYNDAAIRSKLAPKGEAVLVKQGDVVELKTQTLKIGARVVNLVYGSGTPANSYFQQITLELATWSDTVS